MTKIVIFGAQPLASQLWYYLTHDSPDEVVGFTVDSAYRQSDRFHDLPLVDFETVELHFAPADHAMIVSLGVTDQNRLREARCVAARRKGYRLGNFIASRAITYPDLSLGDNSVIYDGAVVQPFASIGSGVTIRTGAVVAHHGTIGDYCYLAPRATLGGNVTLESHCFIGLNATIVSGVTVAERCFVAAGAVVTKDTESGYSYLGSPARRRALTAM